MTETTARPPGLNAPEHLTQKDVLVAAAVIGTGLWLRPPAIADFRRKQMTITCIIRYQIDPLQRDAFQTYAENWGGIIPHCGGHLVGYFLPFDGTNDIGWRLISFGSLMPYGKYKQRLKTDPGAQENFAFARKHRFILREERNFVELVNGTFDVSAVKS